MIAVRAKMEWHCSYLYFPVYFEGDEGYGNSIWEVYEEYKVTLGGEKPTNVE